MKRVLMIVLLLYGIMYCSAREYLFMNGSSDYSIVISEDASVTEKTAAQEFQYYLGHIAGVKLPITTQTTSRMIRIGWTPDCGEPRPRSDDQSFRYYTKNGNLYIYEPGNYTLSASAYGYNIDPVTIMVTESTNLVIKTVDPSTLKITAENPKVRLTPMF